jgi:hypothetical protein
MPSAYSTLRVVRLALATAVAPIASTGSVPNHLSGAVAGDGSSMQPLLSFTVVNTTTAKSSTASLESPIQFGFRRLSASGRTISEVPLVPWVHARPQWPFRSATQMETL